MTKERKRMNRNMESLIKNYNGSSLPKIDVHVHYVPQAYQEPY